MDNQVSIAWNASFPGDCTIPRTIEDHLESMARKICSRPRFARHEQPDIEQDFRIALWQAAHHFDPRRGSLESYYRAVIRNAAASIIRSRLGPKQNGVKISSTILDECCSSVLSIQHSWDAADARSDVPVVRKRLTPELRETFDLLAQHPVRQAAKILGVAPSTIQRRKKRIRAICEDMGLE